MERTFNWAVIAPAVIQKFTVKLAKALFYRHTRRPFEGVIYTRHLDFLSEEDPPSSWMKF